MKRATWTASLPFQRTSLERSKGSKDLTDKLSREVLVLANATARIVQHMALWHLQLHASQKRCRRTLLLNGGPRKSSAHNRGRSSENTEKGAACRVEEVAAMFGQPIGW